MTHKKNIVNKSGKIKICDEPFILEDKLFEKNTNKWYDKEYLFTIASELFKTLFISRTTDKNEETYYNIRSVIEYARMDYTEDKIEFFHYNFMFKIEKLRSFVNTKNTDICDQEYIDANKFGSKNRDILDYKIFYNINIMHFYVLKIIFYFQEEYLDIGDIYTSVSYEKCINLIENEIKDWFFERLEYTENEELDDIFKEAVKDYIIFTTCKNYYDYDVNDVKNNAEFIKSTFNYKTFDIFYKEFVETYKELNSQDYDEFIFKRIYNILQIKEWNKDWDYPLERMIGDLNYTKHKPNILEFIDHKLLNFYSTLYKNNVFYLKEIVSKSFKIIERKRKKYYLLCNDDIKYFLSHVYKKHKTEKECKLFFKKFINKNKHIKYIIVDAITWVDGRNERLFYDDFYRNKRESFKILRYYEINKLTKYNGKVVGKDKKDYLIMNNCDAFLLDEFNINKNTKLFFINEAKGDEFTKIIHMYIHYFLLSRGKKNA